MRLACLPLLAVAVILHINFITSFSIEDAEDVISLTSTVIKTIYRAWETFGTEDEESSPIFKTKQTKVFDSLDRLTKTVDRIENDVSQTSATMIRSLERNLVDNIRLDNKLDDLIETVHSVISNYEKFTTLTEYRWNSKPNKLPSNSSSLGFEAFTVVNFAESVVSYGPNSVRNQLDSIHEMIVPQHDLAINIYQENRLLLIKQHFNHRLHCTIDQSLQQIIYNLFAWLRIAQLKGLIMMQYSYIILRLDGKGNNFATEKKSALDMFNERFRQQIEMTKAIMEDSDNSLWKCDPKIHKSGKTFTEMTRLLQGFLQNENDLSTSHNCYHNCEYYKFVDHYTCTKDTFCVHQSRCDGKLIDCEFVDDNLSVCMANSKGSTRRYESIRALSKGFVLGKKDSCTNGYTQRAEYWRKILIWKCYYCLCLCDEESLLSDRYFNLKPYTSNINENKVVIGVRFIKYNRIIHLQIKQGVLQTKGGINNSTQEWVPLHNYTIETSLNGVTGIRGSDYHALSYGERALDLDDHIAPPRHAVTGVRFRMVGAHINFEVRVTPFNLETGVLSPERSQWASNDNTDAAEVDRRLEFKLPSLKLPTDSIDSEIDVEKDTFLQFTHSDKDSDAWQSTVPFFDTQPVVPNPSTVLSGLGISHKGTKWTAGFVIPKVFTYNMAEGLDWQSDLNY